MDTTAHLHHTTTVISVCWWCVQVPGQLAGPSEAAPPVGKLQPERRPHGSRPLQRGDRHRRAHPARHHIHHPLRLHLLLHTSVQLLLHHLISPPVLIFERSRLSPACWVRRSVFVCQGCRDNPHTGTLYTAVRTHSPNPLGDSPVQILIHGTNAHMLRVNKYLHSTFTFVMCRNNLKNNLKIDFKCSFTACFLLFLGHKVYFILDF